MLQYFSAHAHQLVVESLPIYLVVWSWFTILERFGAQGVMSRSIGTGLPACVDTYIKRHIIFGDREDKLYEDCGQLDVHRPEAFEDNGVMRPMFYMVVAPAVVLIAYTESRLCRTGIADFRSFKYCLFSWSLEQSRTYKVLAGLLSGPPILFVLLTFLMNFVPGTNPTLPVLIDCIPHIAILLLAIKKVILPATPEQAWGQSDLSEVLEHVAWNRSLLDMVSQSNIAFGIVLVDALWSADNGKMQKLRELMADPSDADALLRLCKRLEMLEKEEGASDASDSSDELVASARELKPIA